MSSAAVAFDLLITERLFGMKVYVHRGIIPRAIQQIFEEKEAKPEAGIVVHMSYMEIYQEVHNYICPCCI